MKWSVVAGPRGREWALASILVLGPACQGGPAAGSEAPVQTDLNRDENTQASPSKGRWHPVASTDPAFSPDQREALERLKALPYLQGSKPAPTQFGVTTYDRKRVQPGLNLYNSGHAPEAFLTDLEGKTLHRWSYPIERIWPEVGAEHQATYWRRVDWLPNGDILAVFEGIGLIRLDRDSNLRWAYRDAVHHQAVRARDGTIWVLARKNRVLPRINPSLPVWEDYLVQLSDEGRPLREISLLEAFERSRYRRLLDAMKREGDIFHTNSIEFLDGRFSQRAPWLREGNVLLSAFFLDTIFVLDPTSEEVVWAIRGDGAPTFRGQHDPRILSSGNLLLFDNLGRSGESEVIEFDPVSGRLFWQYPNGDGTLRTPTCGTAQRLDNGDTLITESDQGRALEVTHEGEIVWEFRNPHRAGRRNELVATLFEVRRVPHGFLAPH